MDIRLVGEWRGTPYTFDEFSENVVQKVFDKYVTKSTVCVFKNYRRETANYTKEMLKADFSEYISSVKSENKKKLFIINHAWHDNNECTFNLGSEVYKNLAVNEDILQYDDNKKYDNEIPLRSKSGETMFTFYKDKQGFSVLYCLCDACHVAEGKESVKFFDSFLMKAAIAAGKSDVFLGKYSKTSTEGNDKYAGMKFVSIDEKVSEITKDENKDDIINEMIDKVNIKEIINLLNTAYKYQSGNKSSHVTKEQVTEWLKTWAKNKMNYYVMFGRKLEINQKISFELNYERDGVLINSSLMDIKSKFPKYALILNQFNTSEFFKNQITMIRNELHTYYPMAVGMKVTKYISGLCNDNALDTALSGFIQSKKLDSTIHISIDPMDYLTMSITKHGWHSCHSIIDGQWGSGSTSYMFDNGSLIAHLSNDKVYSYDYSSVGTSFKWTSKSWRQVIYGSTTENNFIFCREYPQDYSNNNISDAVRFMLEKEVSKFCGIPDNWVKKNNGAKNNKNIYKNMSDLHYDDVPSRQTVYIKHVLNKYPSSQIQVGYKTKNPVNGKLAYKNKLFTD